jgi:vacuolar-type H+-ATPase subunit E/Vma4
MALAELLRSLEQDADAQATALLADARAQAASIRADRAGRHVERRAAGLEARRHELEMAAGRATDDAHREATRMLLEARAEALARVRQRAEARLSVATDGASAALAEDLAAAVVYLGSAPVVVEAPATLLAALRRAAPDPARMNFVPANDARRPIIVRSADGGVSVDVSTVSRLARAWPRLAIELASRLECAG